MHDIERVVAYIRRTPGDLNLPRYDETSALARCSPLCTRKEVRNFFENRGENLGRQDEQSVSVSAVQLCDSNGWSCPPQTCHG